jgi:hypothetical protein
MKCFAFILICLACFVARAQTYSVASYNALADATNFNVSITSNSTTVTCASNCFTSAMATGHESIQICMAGPQTIGTGSFGTNTTNNYDLITTVATYVSPTQISISQSASNTASGVYCWVGSNNAVAFSNCIAAAQGYSAANGGAIGTVTIPTGNYLLLGTIFSGNPFISYEAGIVLTGGGVTFNGAGTNLTRLIGQTAWVNQYYPNQPIYYPSRSPLFVELSPITNNYPVTVQNLTLDGGVVYGNIASQNGSIRGIFINPVDGMGWDTTHDAWVIDNASGGTTANALTQLNFSNVVFQHWRGEMVKSLESSTNGNLFITNCVFNDGEATALNIYKSWNVGGNLFNNMPECFEFYQAENTNVGFFVSNILTNMVTALCAFNGGNGTCPTFIMTGNTMYAPYGGNGIQTTPGDNLIISSNQIFCSNNCTAISLGVSGYQGTWDNSNIVIVANTIYNPFVAFQLSGSGPTDPNRCESIYISNNVITNSPFNTNSSANLLTAYWNKNVFVTSNLVVNMPNGNNITAQSGYLANGAFYDYVGINNSYYTQESDMSGTSNIFSYIMGSRYNFTAAQNATTIGLQNSDASQIPPSAQILITNTSTKTIPVYPNGTVTGTAFSLAPSAYVVEDWNAGAGQWQPEYQLWVVSTNVWSGASDSNLGLSSNSAWATFTHVNLGGSYTSAASPTVHISGIFNGAFGSKYNINFPGWSSSSNAPWIIQSEGTTPAGITNSPVNVVECRLNGLSWGIIRGLSFSSNQGPFTNSVVNMTGCTNLEFNGCYFLSNSSSPVFVASSQSGAQGECHQIWIHNCIFSNVLGNLNANCADGDPSADMVHIGSGFNALDNSGGFIIGPSNQFYFAGHALIEMNGPSNRVTGNFFLNYPWQLMTNWVSCQNAAGYTVTNFIYAGGRILGPGGRCCSNTILESNIIAYCGWTLDQPGAEHWEQAGNGISRFETIYGAGGLGIYVNTENVTGGSSCGSNAFYHDSIGLCGSNITFYSSGQLTQVGYPVYQAGIGFSGSSNNAIVDCLLWDNFVPYVSIIGGGQTFAGNIQDWRGNFTNTQPLWASEANSIDTLLPSPVVLPSFALQPGSAAIGAGVWPGIITSTSGSGTSFQSTNAYIFSAGQTAASFVMPGDTIELANGQVTTIQSISGNTVNVSPAVAWTNGMGYDFPFLNAAPSVGMSDLAAFLLAPMTINGAGSGASVNGAGPAAATTINAGVP